MEILTHKMELSQFQSQREEVLTSWNTGNQIDLKKSYEYHHTLSEKKKFPQVLKKAIKNGKLLIQPRAGVALVDEHIKLLKFLEKESDLLPTTIDAYTRQNQYQEAENGIKRSLKAGYSLLNGFPAVNHGVDECRRVIENIEKPIQIRHGTPDARLLAEITLSAGFTAFEGGGISYNIPYAKKIPLEQSIRHWQYVDRLAGLYEENGISINREPFGPLSGTLIPPFISHTVAIIEGLLALEQGCRSITLGYGQGGNLNQDIAAILALKKLAREFFKKFGYEDYEFSTVFHQWMGGFPDDEAKAFAVISWGAVAAALAGATKVIVKTPHEAMGIPTKEANLAGIKNTRQIISMLSDQPNLMNQVIEQEVEVILSEVRALMGKIIELGNGKPAIGAVRSFAAGVIDIPFSPSIYNFGKMLPIRDNHGAIRVLEKANVFLPDEIFQFHQQKIGEREKQEGRKSGFQMVIDDIYAISKGKLVGRPR